MKLTVIVSLLLLVSSLLTGCRHQTSDYHRTDNEKNDIKNTAEQQTNSDEQPQGEGGSPDEPIGVSFSVYETTWQNDKYIYTGEDLEINFEIAAPVASASFSLLIFIDGALTPYYSSENSALSTMQVLETAHTPDQKKNYTLYFKPLSGENGKEYSMIAVLVDNPEGVLTHTSMNLPVHLYHSITVLSDKTLVYDHDTVINDDICTDYDVRRLTDEIEDRFDNFYAKDGNKLNEMVYFAFLAESYDSTPKAEPIDWSALDKDEKLKIYIPFLGVSGEYRVSLYINYEAVPVFDGKTYLDVTVQRDKYTEKVIELDLSRYDGLNHIELYVIDKNEAYLFDEGPLLFQVAA